MALTIKSIILTNDKFSGAYSRTRPCAPAVCPSPATECKTGYTKARIEFEQFNSKFSFSISIQTRTLTYVEM